MEWTAFEITVAGLGALLFLAVCAYVIARAASLAHFKTKLEYYRSMFREGERNGR